MRNLLTQSSLDVPKPQAALLYDMDLPLVRTFYPLGFALEIHTNREEVLLAAEKSFGHRRLRQGHTSLKIRIGVTSGGDINVILPEPVRREYNHLYSMVADTENQAVLDLATGTSFVWLNESALSNQLYLRYNFLEKVVYLLLGASFVTDLHAACVSLNERGILLCGDSGAGKSTLAYACARAGWTYTSDDTTYLINHLSQPKVIGHAHRVRFRSAAKEIFPELQGRAITPRMEGKASIEVPLSELPPIKTSPEAFVHAAVYLKRSPEVKGTLVQLPKRTATNRLGKELFSAGEIRERHLLMLEKLAYIPTYDLHYNDLSEGISQLELLVKTLSMEAPSVAPTL